jgi:hypothetical protein
MNLHPHHPPTKLAKKLEDMTKEGGVTGAVGGAGLGVVATTAVAGAIGATVALPVLAGIAFVGAIVGALRK